MERIQEHLYNTITKKVADDLVTQIDKGSQKVDPKSLQANFFYVSVAAVLEYAECDSEDYLQCKWDVVSGTDWEKVDGKTNGMTQAATSPNSLSKKLVWNYPINITYRSLNPFGWPQLVIAAVGPDFFGHSVVRGYGSVHVPTSPGYHERTLNLYKPVTKPTGRSVFGIFTNRSTHYETPSEILAKGEGREVTRVQTIGKVKVKFTIVEKNMKKFGYL